PVDEPYVPLFVFLSELMIDSGTDPFDFLRRVQVAHPTDFWVNLRAGDFCYIKDRSGDAIRYFQAALAVRPNALVHANLGMALARERRSDEALEHLREAERLDPTVPGIHTSLACVLRDASRYQEAIQQLRKGLKISPESASLHSGLGTCLEGEKL